MELVPLACEDGEMMAGMEACLSKVGQAKSDTAVNAT